MPEAGVAAVNALVVSRADYVFDAAAPDGSLSMAEAARLDVWFRSLGLRYGDNVYVDGGYLAAATGQVADMAGQYGLMVTPGAPVTAGAVAPGMVRVVVSRVVAGVLATPTGTSPRNPLQQPDAAELRLRGELQPRSDGRQPRGPGLAGRAGSGVGDAATATRAINAYRATPDRHGGPSGHHQEG